VRRRGCQRSVPHRFLAQWSDSRPW
jgi:hypothetical protein